MGQEIKNDHEKPSFIYIGYDWLAGGQYKFFYPPGSTRYFEILAPGFCSPDSFIVSFSYTAAIGKKRKVLKYEDL